MKSVLSALRLATSAEHPTVEISDTSWTGNPEWKQNYNKVDETNREELLHLGQENRRKRAENKAQRLTR